LRPHSPSPPLEGRGDRAESHCHQGSNRDFLGMEDSCVKSHCSAVRNLPAPQGEGMGVGSQTFHPNSLLLNGNKCSIHVNYCFFSHTDSSDFSDFIYCKNRSSKSSVFVSRHSDSTDNSDSTDSWKAELSKLQSYNFSKNSFFLWLYSKNFVFLYALILICRIIKTIILK